MDYRDELEWISVIKVKCGDTIRRLVTSVHGCLMDYNMSKLRDKIISLFKLHHDADLILTYTDGDNDVITLDNDDELCDAVINQRLNPLRIKVQLKTDGNCNPQSEASKSTDTVSPPIDTVPNQISSAVEDALKSLPRPLHETYSSLSQGSVLKTASSASALANLVQCLAKTGLGNASQSSTAASSGLPGTSSGALTNLMDLRVTDEPKASAGPVSVTITLNTNSGIRVPECTPTNVESGNMIQGPQGTAPTSVLNLDPYENLPEPEVPFINDSLICTGHSNKNSDVTTVTVSAPPSGQAMGHSSNNYAVPKPFPSNPAKGAAEASGGDNYNFFSTNATVSPNGYMSQYHVNLHKNMVLPLLEVPHPSSLSSPTLYRTHSYHDSMLRTAHKGVRCDGCGMYPIMGPRFTSKVKFNYDLCYFCFSDMGNEADYTKIEIDNRADHRGIDHAHYPYLRQLMELYYPNFRNRSPSHAPPGCGPSQLGINREEHNSLFIQDITVVDGTMMPPCTPFTKIWRMRNNGFAAWPIGTQLVWILGANFGQPGSIALKIPANGCPVNGEIDIAADFTSPSRPGSYLSYWQMASPSGQKFGQCIWVQILVKNPQLRTAAGVSHANFNLNQLPETIELDPLVDGLSQPMPNPTDAFPSSPFYASPATDMLQHGLDSADIPVKQTLEDACFEQIDLNMAVIGVNKYEEDQSVGDSFGYADWDLDPLLVELQEMGFNDEKLNKKLLVQNGGSIKMTVLDLIGGKDNMTETFI